MSSIDSISAFGMQPGLFSTATRETEGSKPPAPPDGAPPPGATEDGANKSAAMMERIESLASEAGLDSETIAALQEELQTTIASVLENANQDAESGDPRQAVHSAVESVLEKYGISAENLMPKGQVQDPMMAQVESLAAKAGLKSDTTATLLEELRSAISAAVEEADHEAGSADPRQAVHTIVQSILEKYGIDADQLKPPAHDPGFGGGGPRAAGSVNPSPGSEGRDLYTGSPTGPNQGVLSSLLDLLQVVDEEA